MKKTMILTVLAVTAVGAVAALAAQQPAAPPAPMTFFVTSETGTGNLGGVAGADARCQRLAAASGAAGAANRNLWRAYLSTQGAGAVNARDRIGAGPWHGAKGEMIAANVADLHGDNERDRNNLYKGSALDEKGNIVPGRGDMPNQHDILTGSDSLGRAFPAAVTEDRTCRNWTYDGDENAGAQVGHNDRNGGGTTSWNSGHRTPGCSVPALARVGGAGRLYCFATN